MLDNTKGIFVQTDDIRYTELQHKIVLWSINLLITGLVNQFVVLSIEQQKLWNISINIHKVAIHSV